MAEKFLLGKVTVYTCRLEEARTYLGPWAGVVVLAALNSYLKRHGAQSGSLLLHNYSALGLLRGGLRGEER